MRSFRVAGALSGRRGLLRTIVAFVGAGLVLLCGLYASHASAQSVPGFSLDQVQQLQQSLQQQGLSGIQNYGVDGQRQSQKGQTLEPANSDEGKNGGSNLPRSRLEQILSSRVGVKLDQFGYDQVGFAQSVRVPDTGGTPNNYVLGPGDELVVSFRGQENSEYRTQVNRDGRVLLPRLSPLNAAGQTLSDFRDQLLNAVHRAYISTEAFVSLGQLRQVSVMVSGEVQNPGMRIVTGLSSPLDAILLSGGVKKTGSLRSIKLVHKGEVTTIDLYSVLTDGGNPKAHLLSDGDRIIVPPLGRTIAVAGWVRRPGIYEMPPGQSALSVRGLITLGGGLEVRGQYHLSVLRVSKDGGTHLETVSNQSSMVRDSDILVVQPKAERTESRATLSGGTPLAGQYAVKSATKLSDLLKAPGALGKSPYTLFGTIARRDTRTELRTLIPFTPVAVKSGTVDMDLQSDDIVRVFSTDEARLLTAAVSEYRKRREQAEEQLRAPNRILQDMNDDQDQNNRNSGQSNSQNPNTQSNENQGPNTPRQDIAEISNDVLGDGGVLVPRPNYYMYGQNQSQSQLGQSGGANQPGYQQSGAMVGQPNYSQQIIQNSQIPPQLLPNNQQPKEGQQNNAPNFERQLASPGEVPSNQSVVTFGDLARQLDVDPLVLMNFLMDNDAQIEGAVRGPGNYFVGPYATLQDLVAAAGGTQGWADESGVEVISTSVNAIEGKSKTTRKLLSLHASTLSNYIVKPHDEIRFNQVYTSVGAGMVTIQGQVRYPGRYPIERGEHLSDLMLRAGGLTDVAYPYGTIFLRKSAAKVERKGYERMASEIQNVMVAGMTRVGSGQISPSVFQAMQGFIKDLRDTKPLGRVSIIADPALLASNSAQNPLLEPDDVIFIPQRPSSVTVLGQVMQQGSFPFSPKMTVDDYIEQAGGTTQFADTSLTFLVLPNGQARRAESSWFNLSSPDIPPGSTIVVSRDAAPLDIRQILFDSLGVLQNLAVSAASLAVLSR